ncbi:unnamed protein product [Dibothriocephalus latus]|uniref:Uncharacterized protein n=1 Tax=Dibothriocephalus latus TaxID=60516 RepID=A0A3P6PLF2_DIBLA|nr:unnamed protein product [Dibothriocephalus latus]
MLRTDLRSISPDNVYEGIQFPVLKLVVLIYCNRYPDKAMTVKYESYFPGAKVHFGLQKRRRDIDPKDCATYYFQNSVEVPLRIEDPEVYACPSGVSFMGCSEFYISGDRIVPLSLEEVDLQFILEPILESRGVSLVRNAIEEIILKADVRISRLRCEVAAEEVHNVMRLRQGYGMIAMLKFLPLLTAQKDILTSLDIAAELLVGCLRIPEALRQIKSLRGQLVNVVELIAITEEDQGGAPFYKPTVRSADLRPLLAMCPSLKSLEIRFNMWC